MANNHREILLLNYEQEVQIVTTLDEFLRPLHEGVWEVIVPKESVTEPLDPSWVKSRINVPSPGTRASYRKGQYHAHEQQTEWHVHLDNYDPKVHPVLHLIDDAPLLLMIGDTVVTLIAGTRKKTGKEEEILKDQVDQANCLTVQRIIFAPIRGIPQAGAPIPIRHRHKLPTW